MPIKVYTATSNRSCRKAIAWLEKYDIPYVEKNVSSEPLTKEELTEILSLTAEGTDEIIAKKSKGFKKLKVDLDGMTLNELYKMLQENPGLLRLPVLVDGVRLQIGYNDDEIRQFLPRYFRANELQSMLALEM
jgi:regulatory protein spx